MALSGSPLSCSCLLYQYLKLEEYLFISGNDASCRSDNHLPRPCQSEKITPRHPTMAICSGNDVSVSGPQSALERISSHFPHINHV